MELALIQSQEHEKLPYAELNAVLEAENIKGNVNKITPGLTIIESLDEKDYIENYKILVERLAYTHEIDQIIKKSTLYNLKEDILSIDWNKFIKNNFAVRVKRFSSEIDTVKCERKVGSWILSTFNKINNVSVKLKNPESLIRIISFKNQIFIAIEKFKLNKKHFENIKPHKRPFFYPGSMSPKLARCMVNLTRVKKNDLVLDPFCGTGGILLEAGMIGCKVIGSDVNWKMKNGTSINLNHYNIKNFKTFHVDVRELKMYEKVDAVVTDPPYGISTSTGDVDSDEIFKKFLHSIYKNMKDNAYLCMASPHYLNLDNFLEELGFKLIERYEIKMHRSLTRIISLLTKIN